MLWSDNTERWVTVKRGKFTLLVDVKRLEAGDNGGGMYEAHGKYFPGHDTPPQLFRVMKTLREIQTEAKKQGKSLSWSLSTLGQETGIQKDQCLQIPLVRIKIGKCDNQPKKILILSGVHSREWPAQEVTLMLMSQLLNYEQSMLAVGGHLRRNDKLSQGTIIDIVPVVSLFGFLYCLSGPDRAVQIETSEDTEEGEGEGEGEDPYTFYNSRSKKRVPSRDNRTVSPGGCDLNRNYPHNWGRDVGCSHTLGEEDYCGPHPASESETQAIMELVKRNKYNLTMDIHSFGDFVVMPPCYNASKSLPLNSEPFLTSLKVAELAPPILFPHLKGTPDGTVPKKLYPCAGSFVDYCIFGARTKSMTMELGGDVGGFSADHLPTQHSKMAMPHRIITLLNTVYDII